MVWLSVTAAPIFKASASALDWVRLARNTLCSPLGRACASAPPMLPQPMKPMVLNCIPHSSNVTGIFQKGSRWCSTIVEEKGGKVNIQTIK